MSSNRLKKPISHILVAVISGLLSSQILAAQYSLEEAVAIAQSQDPWITGSVKRQESLDAMSVEAGTLPDPSVSIGLANVPIDSFDFSQEGMTQFKVGVSQMFPRGKSLALKREKLEKLGQIQPLAREDRRAQVSVTVSQLWLDVYRYQATIDLIERDRSLFEYLVDVAQSSYSTGSGKTRQQDLVRAQLELTRLDDRLTTLHLQSDTHLARLGEWLADPSIQVQKPLNMSSVITLRSRELILESNHSVKLAKLAETLGSHPKVKQIDQKISALGSNVKLAEQSYKPQWGLNASYGYRDQTPMGEDRSDFFSVGVTFDVPLFTGNRQDKKVQSAVADQEGVKTERALVLRQLKSGFEMAEAQYLRLIERKSLFDTRLLKEMSEQAEASLSAYTHDDGDFAEVVRSRIAELNARIEALNVDIDIQKIIAQLNYFQVGKGADSHAGADNKFNTTALDISEVFGDEHE